MVIPALVLLKGASLPSLPRKQGSSFCGGLGVMGNLYTLHADGGATQGFSRVRPGVPTVPSPSGQGSVTTGTSCLHGTPRDIRLLRGSLKVPQPPNATGSAT